MVAICVGLNVLMMGGCGVSSDIVLRWLSLDFTDVNIGSGNGSWRHQTITRAHVAQDLCRHMASQDHNELKWT